MEFYPGRLSAFIVPTRVDHRAPLLLARNWRKITESNRALFPKRTTFQVA